MQEINEINSKPSARYALALFSLCEEEKNISEIEKHVVKLLEILKSDNGLNTFLRNPTFSSIDQENVFGNISSKIKLPQKLHNAICLMIRKGRGYDLVNFGEDFMKLCLVNKNRNRDSILRETNICLCKLTKLQTCSIKIIKCIANLI